MRCKTDLEVRLFDALKRISQYQSPEHLRKFAAREYGLDDADEAIEMAYENVIFEAQAAVKGITRRTDPQREPGGRR